MRSEQDFVAYFDNIISKRHPNSSNSIVFNWMRVSELLRKYSKGQPIPFKTITVKLLEDIKMFFLRVPQGGNKKGTVSQNTASTYFSILKAGLKQAFVDEYLTIDISAKVKGIVSRQVKRESLTMEEVRRLASTPCESDVLRRASLFSILTGIRHCDLQAMRWRQIQRVEDAWRGDFTQQNTKVADYLPISNQAYTLCGEPQSPDKLVFENLTDASWISRPLKKWVEAAGITKHITFHCFRHTFATLQLEKGTDIYTIKAMLGHTNVRTTQIYAHIVDPSTRKAANAIYIDEL